MARINEHVFKLNNEEYKLTWFDKPRITKNGIEQKVLPVLKEYIIRENLPIQLVNKRGNNEVPYTLARKILEYFSDNVDSLEHNIKKNDKVEYNIKKKSSLQENNLIKESYSPNANENSRNSIFLITCSSSKIKEKELKDKSFDFENLSFNKELKQYRKELIEIITNPKTVHLRKQKIITNKINFSKTELAYLVYSEGKFYNEHAACSKDWSIEVTQKNYIVSALFGLIRADDYIPLYDLAMNDKINNCRNFAQKFWKGKLDNLIFQLHKNGGKIYNLLSIDYSNCFNEQSKGLLITPKIEFTKSDAPLKRGRWLKSILQ
jgi:cytoplasmic iron level regulating protein YaaA (DUF328/UPF0246 family)